MANQPIPLTYPPLRNKGLRAGFMKGKQWLTNPDRYIVELRIP